MYIETLRMAVNETAKLPNAFIYGFDNKSSLTIKQLKKYKSLLPEYNSRILTWIKNGQQLLTPENLEAYLEIITTKAEQYSVLDIGHRIKKYLESDI